MNAAKVAAALRLLAEGIEETHERPKRAREPVRPEGEVTEEDRKAGRSALRRAKLIRIKS